MMIDLGKKNVLGVLVDAVDYEAAVMRIVAAARAHRPFAVSALAVHGVMTGVQNASHRYRLNHLDLVTPDGQPVRWSLNWLHDTRLPDRVYGPTLMLKVCTMAAAEGLPVFLYGSRPQVLEALARNLRACIPLLVIAGMQPSRFRQLSPTEKEAVAETILQSGANIVFVGLGCPRQEVWVYEHRQSLPMPLLAVGAAFDFHAGSLPQAPPILQRYGLEWSYRLFQEPKRLWRRYLPLNPLYLWLLFLQKSGLRTFDADETEMPLVELRYG